MQSVDRIEGFNETSIKSLLSFGDISVGNRGIILYLIERINTVNFPAVDQADGDRIFRTEKGTSHAHLTMIFEADATVFFRDVVYGTHPNTRVAFDAFRFIHAIEFSVDMRARTLNGKQSAGEVI